MPRPKKANPTERMTVYVEAELLQKVDILLTNPLSGNIKYGARSALVERLLREWLNTQRENTHA